MKTPDEQIIEIFKRTNSYSATAGEMNLSILAIKNRIDLLRSLGWDLPAPVCQVKGCKKRHYAKGLCAAHIQKRRRGTLDNGQTN